VRSRDTIKSELGEIPRIGQVRQKQLLKYFGTVEKIKEAEEEELAKAPKMNRKSAQSVYRFYHNRKG
jgi:excinuclease ABC subunit C